MRIVTLLGLGIFIGSIAGTLGIGGGVLLVPALMFFCKFDPAHAAGTSLAVLTLPFALLPGAIVHYRHGRVDVEAALWLAVAFAVGSFLGSHLVSHVSPQALRLMFGFMMLFVSFTFIVVSNSQVATAASGLVATAIAWLLFALLRVLGRKHMLPPDLRDQIRKKQQEGWGEIEYHI